MNRAWWISALLKINTAFLDVAPDADDDSVDDTEVELEAEDDSDEDELDGVQLRYFETKVISPVVSKKFRRIPLWIGPFTAYGKLPTSEGKDIIFLKHLLASLW